jgi:chromosome partitioning protein
MGKTFAIVSQKGGSGKTTTALNLGAAFAVRKLRTLLIDLDPQGGSAFGLGLKPGDYTMGINDLLLGKADIRDLLNPTESPYLRFIPSGCFSNVAEIDRFSNLGKKLGALRRAIVSVRDQCDVILFDTPPGENSLVVSALNCADSVIIPLQCEPLALRTLPQILRLIREVKTKVNPALLIEGVLLTMYDVRYGFTEQVSEQVWKNFPRDLVFETIIPRREDFSKAFIQGRPAVFESPLAPSALAYLQLADEIISDIAQSIQNTQQSSSPNIPIS